jgi:hypothetical protein
MSQLVGFRMDLIIDNIERSMPELWACHLKSKAVMASEHSLGFYTATCSIYLAELFMEFNCRHTKDYWFESASLDEHGKRWLYFRFNDPEAALMIKLRGILNE